MKTCYVKAYFDWIEQTAALSDAERGRLFIAILEYARSGLDPKLDGREGILFPVFKVTIDRDIEKSTAYSENGKKGGRGNKANESKLKQNKANESESPNIRHKTKEKETILSHYVRENSKEESAEPLAGSTPPAICLLLNDGTEYPVSVEQCQEWAGLYPAVDVIQQLRQMKGWLDANPDRRKTKRGVNAFIVRWLAKEQDRGGAAAAQPKYAGKPGYRAQGHHDELNPLERAAVDRLFDQPQRPLKGVEKLQYGVQRHGEELSAFQLEAIDRMLESGGEDTGGAENGG